MWQQSQWNIAFENKYKHTTVHRPLKLQEQCRIYNSKDNKIFEVIHLHKNCNWEGSISKHWKESEKPECTNLIKCSQPFCNLPFFPFFRCHYYWPPAVFEQPFPQGGSRPRASEHHQGQPLLKNRYAFGQLARPVQTNQKLTINSVF